MRPVSYTHLDVYKRQVGHRVVHGGEKFSDSGVITEEVIAQVEECNDLAPLHNPANIIGIRACQALMPNVPDVYKRQRSDEAVENVLNMFAHTKSNKEFVNLVKKNRIL